MKSRIKTGILKAARAGLFTILALTAESARAAVPELINFQGKLTDSAGTAITTSVPMVFKFYTTATGGSLVWTENQDVLPDDTGLYSVLLGSATSFSTYGISFSTSYWLGVTVGTDLEMTPRYKIVSSAYALYSINSGTAAYSVNSGTSAWANGVDWPMINHKPVFGAGDVYLASTQTFTGSNIFTGPGTFLSTAAFTAQNPSTPGVTISSGLVVTAGNVGIGTNIPVSTLTVVGTFMLVNGSQAAGNVLTSDANGLATWQTAATGGDVYKASTQTFTGENTFKAGTYFSSSAYVTGGGIYSTGSIGGVSFSGIGTRFMWIPEKYALRAGNVTGAQWDAGNIGNFSTAFGNNNTASGVASNIAGGTGNNVTGQSANIAGGTSNTASEDNASVAGGARNKATGFYSTVTGGDGNAANGNWSIVAGGIGNTANSDYSFAAGYRSSSTASGAFTWSDSEGALVDNNVADRTWFKNRGGFLITNTTNAGGAAFSIDSSGYVAVGTMLAPSTFTVVGTFKLIDGTAAAGRVLTSDANGLARWQAAGVGGDVYKASTQTFTGSNTFISTTAFTALDPSLPGVTISSGLIVSAGNVGIGTMMAPSNVTVIGTFLLADGSAAAGRVLTSDANGLASWQAAGVGGDVYKASTQTFTGVNTFMANTYFSSSAYFTNGGIYSTGTAGGTALSGAGTRFMWMPEKKALRAGGIDGTQWNSGSIGDYSAAFGFNNTASGLKSIAAGGEYNTAGNQAATVSGGLFNAASGQYSTVAGGAQSTASGQYSTVAGGLQNTASGIYAIVAGGYNNTAGERAAVAGGESNRASDTYAAVGGGKSNTASAYAATVSGGQGNTASNTYATVAGGDGNTANGAYSFAAGRASSSAVEGTFTWADSDGTQVDNDVFNRTWFKNRGGFLVTASTDPADGGMFLNNSNYVGLGTLVPTSTLTVIGTFKLADGSQGSGKVLTSDAVGLAAWAAPAGPVYAVTQVDNLHANPTLTDIPMLSIALIANATYQFEAELSCGVTPSAVGLQFAVAFPAAGATVEAVIYGPVSSAAMKNSRITAINTATSNYLTESSLTGGILIKGIITTTSSGNLTIQDAAPNPNSSTVYKGSYLKVTKI